MPEYVVILNKCGLYILSVSLASSDIEFEIILLRE